MSAKAPYTEPAPAYLRREAAARYLDVSPRTLSDWQARRVVPYVRAGRRCILFKRSDLDAAMDRLTVRSVGG